MAKASDRHNFLIIHIQFVHEIIPYRGNPDKYNYYIILNGKNYILFQSHSKLPLNA